ncbi:hypothetical protein WCLP8_4000005 [uncultured Gammaproteobacteria bacterium]
MSRFECTDDFGNQSVIEERHHAIAVCRHALSFLAGYSAPIKKCSESPSGWLYEALAVGNGKFVYIHVAEI